MIRLLLGALIFLPALSLADSWEFRLGLAQFPEQNTMLGAEVTRVFDLTERTELGVGAVLHTDFSQVVGPGLIGRLKHWLTEYFALGASSELGYLYHQSASNPNSYTYFLIGPLFAVQIKPVYLQWEPGELFYQGTNQLVPLRFILGFVF